MPDGTLAGGGMPGPTLLTQSAAAAVGRSAKGVNVAVIVTTAIMASAVK
jgi:hypothetical protein